MYILASLVMSIAPAVFFVCYFYRQDTRKPEPKGLIVKLFIWGAISVFPAIALELAFSWFFRSFSFSRLLYSFFRAFLIAALCEEFIKLQIVKRTVYNNVNFDEVMDGIVYTVTASLGFACLENIFYVMNKGLSTALSRAFTAVPMHAIASGIMGYYIGKAKFANSLRREKSLIYIGLFLAILIHGFYDFLLFAHPVINLITLSIFPLIVGTFIALKNRIKSAIEKDTEALRF